ncbi:MAG: MFS transporter, partial [Anaerolineae bacterium]|nr:MFS transporter [Anaerolineae bacterium]
ATLQGIVTAIDNPMRQAFIAEVVGREHLVNAVALNSMSFNAARVVGPGLAGLVIAKIGIAPTLFVNAVSFIAVLWAYFMMDVTSLHAAPPSTKVPARQQLVEGLSYTWHTRPILLIMLIVGIIGTFGFNFSVILPLLANFVLHTDAAGYGALSSFLGIGALIAAVSSAYVHHVTMRRLLIGSAAFSVVLALVAISATFTVSAMLLVALGFSGIIFSTTSNTLLQLLVPNELRGRVMSLYVLLFMGSTPIGGFLIGFLANTIGVSAGLVFCAALCLVGVIAVLIYRRATPNETIAA